MIFSIVLEPKDSVFGDGLLYHRAQLLAQAVSCVMEEARYLFGTNSTNRYKSIHAIASLKLLRSR